MITTIYRPTRGARLAAAKALRKHVRGLIADALIRYRNGATTTRALATGELVTITTHMIKLGADPELLRRYASHAGKKVREAYDTLTSGAEPTRVWTVRNGRPISVFAYAADDQALTFGLRTYSRTAHLVTV